MKNWHALFVVLHITCYFLFIISNCFVSDVHLDADLWLVLLVVWHDSLMLQLNCIHRIQIPYYCHRHYFGVTREKRAVCMLKGWYSTDNARSRHSIIDLWNAFYQGTSFFSLCMFILMLKQVYLLTSAISLSSWLHVSHWSAFSLSSRGTMKTDGESTKADLTISNHHHTATKWRQLLIYTNTNTHRRPCYAVRIVIDDM